MRTWDEAIKIGLDIYNNREKYCYFYGAKGQTMTDTTMDALIAAQPTYFSKYTMQQIEDIKNYSRGKIGLDCSGFTGKCIGNMTYSGAQIENCGTYETLAGGPAGSLLYKPGHIGLDIGYGYFLHFPIEGRTCELSKISNYDWQKSGQSKAIDYSGADAR